MVIGGLGASGEAISLVCADEAPMLAAIETLLKQTLSREEEPGFEPDHRIPLTGAAAIAAKKIKKPKVAGGRGSKGTPSNWVGFDAAPKRPGARPSARPGGSPRSTGKNGQKQNKSGSR